MTYQTLSPSKDYLFVLFFGVILFLFSVNCTASDFYNRCAKFHSADSNTTGKICNIYVGNFAIFSVDIEQKNLSDLSVDISGNPKIIKKFYLDAASSPIVIVQRQNALYFFDSPNKKNNFRHLGTWKTTAFTEGIHFSHIISYAEISDIFQEARVGVTIKFLGMRNAICTKSGIDRALLKETTDADTMHNPAVMTAFDRLSSVIYSRCKLSETRNFKFMGIRIYIPKG